MQQPTYDEQITMKNEMKLRELCAGLPAFCKEFFRGIEPTTSSRTRIAYAYDLKIFFHFLQEKYPDIEALQSWHPHTCHGQDSGLPRRPDRHLTQ